MASRSLVVICSPHAAASVWVGEEIRTWKAMGRTDRVFPLVVAGEPHASDRTRAASSECFPLALRYEVRSDGTITDRRTEPLAADVRSGKDSWKDAALKLVAGILGLGFDDLRRREAVRERRRRLVASAVAVVASLAAMLFYAALADADMEVPGGGKIRTQLDRYGLTVFRPVVPEQDMQRLAIDIRQHLRQRLWAGIDSGELERPPISAWLIGQVLAAAFRDRATPTAQLKTLPRFFDVIFLPPGADTPDASNLVASPDDVGNPGRAEPAFWAIIALSAALARSDVLTLDEQRRLAGYLRIAQKEADTYHPLGDGGWNTAAHQQYPSRHFVYTTAMALHVLLQLKATGLGWLDSREQLDFLIRRTASWLITTFVDDTSQPGWRRSNDDDRQPDEGITLLVFSALGRACAVAGVSIPDKILTVALNAQADLRYRSYKSGDPDIRYDVAIIGANGARVTQVTVTRMIWYPWAVQGLVSWRRCASKLNLPAEKMRAIDRSLGHLLANVSAGMLHDVTRPEKPSFVNAETYYGVGTAP